METQGTQVFPVKQLSEQYDHLAPDCSEIRLLVEGTKGGLAHCTLSAGHVLKAVLHRKVEELWYCTAGMGQVWRQAGKSLSIVDVQPGTSLLIPKRTRFQFRNNGEMPLTFIIATMPPWPGEQEAIPVAGYWPVSDQCTEGMGALSDG